MSGPDRYEPVINGAAMRQAKAGAYVLFTDYETAARDNDGLRAELNFARDDIRELATVRDELRALLDEAPHTIGCSIHMKQRNGYSKDGECDCWKSRIPRAGG